MPDNTTPAKVVPIVPIEERIDLLAAEACPVCDGDVETGYGLAFGGCGPYVFCIRDGCRWFHKDQDPE